MSDNQALTRADILAPADYAAKRWEFRRKLASIRALRRVEIGPFATFSFECRETMWHQIHEMLYIEKGGEQQIVEELAAYNPLIPNGSELVATMMIEIEDAERRARHLRELGGIEKTVSLRVGNSIIAAQPEQDQERTREDGKTSAIHFLRFPFTQPEIAEFRRDHCEIILAVAHVKYRHMAGLSEEMRRALEGDFAN